MIDDEHYGSSAPRNNNNDQQQPRRGDSPASTSGGSAAGGGVRGLQSMGAGDKSGELRRMSITMMPSRGDNANGSSDASQESSGVLLPMGGGQSQHGSSTATLPSLHNRPSNTNNSGSTTSNHHHPNSTATSPLAMMTPQGGAPSSPSFDDDDKASNHSYGSSHHNGTNSTGSGEGEDHDPFLNIIVDILRKAGARNAAGGGAGKNKLVSPGNDALSPDTSQHAPSPGEFALAPPPECGSGAVVANDSLSAKSPTAADRAWSLANGHTVGTKGLIQVAKSELQSVYANIDSASARALVIADPQASEIVWVNEAAQRLFGRLDLVGSKLESLMPQELAERHAGIISAFVERYIGEYKKTGEPPDSRLLDVVKPRRMTVIRKVNGRDVPLHIDGWVRSIRIRDEHLDKPPRIMALEAVEVEQAHVDNEQARIFKAALQNVSDGMVIADYDGRIEWINGAMEKLCGYPLAALRAVRASVNVFLPTEMVAQHEGFLQHFRNTRTAAAAGLKADSQAVVVSRRVEMRTALPPFKEEILLRVEVAYNKLIAFIKSTSEFIPRDEFENERLKLLLPASVVKLLRGADSSMDISSHFWEFEKKTVMFTDVEGFSDWAKSRSAKVVHDRMQPMFAEFEDIIQAFGGELVHRVGDAVLAVFGLNGEERHHARYAVACAAELQQWSAENHFSVRIGLHSGTIGAGIYGSTKGRPGFDVWGPVVNAAKRLESTAQPGSVHITKQVVEALGHRMAGPIHTVVVPFRLEGIKGVPDQETFILPVVGPVPLPEKLQQAIGMQRAKYARWQLTERNTQERLAALTKGAL